MKCIACGSKDIEKSDYEKAYTLPFEYESNITIGNRKRVQIPRYTYVCLSCGFVQQYIDIEERKSGLMELLDYIISDHLTEPKRDDTYIERVPARTVAEQAGIPYDLGIELLRILVLDHKGYSVQYHWAGYITPVLEKIDNEILVVGKQRIISRR